MSQDIAVGDIIFLGNNEEVPCDVVVLSTSEPEGTCYIQVLCKSVGWLQKGEIGKEQLYGCSGIPVILPM
jgi:hypothetical protein